MLVFMVLYFSKDNVRPWLSWIEYLTTNQGVTGSNPVGRTNFNLALEGFFIIKEVNLWLFQLFKLLFVYQSLY